MLGGNILSLKTKQKKRAAGWEHGRKPMERSQQKERENVVGGDNGR